MFSYVPGRLALFRASVTVSVTKTNREFKV